MRTLRKAMRYAALSATFIILSIFSFSQTKDAALWGDVSLKKKIVKKTYVHLNAQAKLQENFSRFTNASYELGIDYSANEHIDLAGAYIYRTNNSLENTLSAQHRYYGSITFGYETYNFKFTNRSRFQSNVGESNISDAYYKNKVASFYRNKTAVRYFLSKQIQPFVAFEVYYRLNNFKAWENYYYRTRTAIGIFYRLNKKQKLEFYYLWRHGLKKKQPDDLYVLGLGFSQTLK